MTKASVIKKDSPQYNILYQNPGYEYTAFFQILTSSYPTLSRFPHLLICAPPTQIVTETVSMHFQHYIDFIGFRGFLEENRSTLNMPSELDKFISGLTNSELIFQICREECLSGDPSIQRKFIQGALVTTLAQYLSELNLLNGAPYSCRSRYENSDIDSDSNLPRRPALSRFSSLHDSAQTTSFFRSAQSSSK